MSGPIQVMLLTGQYVWADTDQYIWADTDNAAKCVFQTSVIHSQTDQYVWADTCQYVSADMMIKEISSCIGGGRTDSRTMSIDRILTFFTVRHEIHRLFRLYIHWSTKICELSHVPLATEYVCFFGVIRHEDVALKCISWLLNCHECNIHCQFYLKPYSH